VATLCEGLASDLTAIDAAAVPAEARAYARRALLDAFGAALAGSRTPEVANLLSALRSAGAQGPKSVWATSVRLSAPHAALVNGTATHALEVDDFGGCGHSGAVVVPAALAAAEHRSVTGVELLSALIAGYEAAARVIDSVGGYPEHNATGWHSTGTCGTFGAAAAAARILELDIPRTGHALALAGTYTGGLWSFIPNGAMSKRLHAGKAAEGGVAAAYLAAHDFTGPTHLFEPGWGSFTSLYGGAHAAPERLRRAPGDRLLIFRSGFKPYACCRGCHSSLDVILGMMRSHDFAAADVDGVSIRASEQQARQLGKQAVTNMLDAQMSLPYSVAVALLHGRADLRLYQSPYLEDAGLAALARRVNVVAETRGAATSEPTVDVTLRDGRVLTGQVKIAKGAPENPLSDEEMVQKFLALATMAVSPATASEIVAFVATIETAPTISPLFRMLSGTASATSA
jgi:2-methylcitrate dehydratase PrpD